MHRVIFFVIYAALGAYLIFSVLQFRNALLAASERTSASRLMRLEAETRVRERPRTLLFVGDIMLSRGVGRAIERERDPLYPFLRIAEITRAADFAFGNLESPISDRGERQNQGFAFRADPSVIHGLVYAGFDALSVANNHIFDYGREAYEDTMRRLSANGIEPITGEPYIITIHDTRIAFLAYAPVLPSFDTTSALTTIRMLRASTTSRTCIIVSLHWGEEYTPQPSDAQRALARALIDAGADLVIGHHPHVVQEVEKYIPSVIPAPPVIPANAGIQSSVDPRLRGDAQRVGYIAYSLGNFVFDQNFSEETMRGLMLRVFVVGGRITKVEEVPVRLTDSFQPYAVY